METLDQVGLDLTHASFSHVEMVDGVQIIGGLYN